MTVISKLVKEFFSLVGKLALGVSISCMIVTSQNRPQLKYSDMETWQTRTIKESWLIGGKEKVIYEIGTPATANGAKPRDPGDSPWETSSIWAHVTGINKVSSTVTPEKRGNGTCVLLESKIEKVKVIGILNVSVMATGAIYTGLMREPIKGADDPMQYLVQGVPWTERIAGIKFDYKAKVGAPRQRITVGSKKDLGSKNEAEVSVVLQKRWETPDGEVHAIRIATAYMRIKESVDDWINGYFLPVTYGDITQCDWYRDFMGLNYEPYPITTLNSKGKHVKIVEERYEKTGEEIKPTHIIVRFSCGYGGAFIGAEGDKFWVDNIEIVYPD